MYKKSLSFIITILFIIGILCTPVFAKNINGVWHNDLKNLFLKNNAIIYTINLRTFSAKDKNGNELIDPDEESGNFINAVFELDNLVKMGINTIHVLPITPVGKIKAYGTAGSLYALSGFDTVNPQLVSKNSSLSAIKQAKYFVSECHKRNIRVIMDLPSCGAYDLYLEHPEYFSKDKENNPIVICDWSDVRLFDCGNEVELNEELFNAHKKYIDMILSIGADGLRADVARLKSEKFWRELINYARLKDNNFLFLAEASNLWTEPLSDKAFNLTVEQLFNAGFDGYLGDYLNLKNIHTAKELTTLVENDLKLFDKYDNQKSVIGSFSTHDIISPILSKGENFSKMIIWLNTTLPLNSYYIDGFPTGDTYSYSWANKLASDSQTDDNYYFTHNGQIDIFNFSRKPGSRGKSGGKSEDKKSGEYTDIYDEFVLANKFKQYFAQDLSNAKYITLKSSNPKVFAYARVCNNMSIVVIGNLDFAQTQESLIKLPKFKPNMKIINMRVHQNISNAYLNNKIKTVLSPGDIQVLMIKNLVF